MSIAQDIDYFNAKARQCFRLADACTDAEAASRLRQLGHEFADQALRLGADPAMVPTSRFHQQEQPKLS